MHDTCYQYAQDNREKCRMMQRYREKSHIIEAVQFDPQRFPWPECMIPWPDASGCQPRDMSYGYIHTADGRANVKALDWIVKGASGEPHICPDKVFSSMYELVEVPLD